MSSILKELTFPHGNDKITARFWRSEKGGSLYAAIEFYRGDKLEKKIEEVDYDLAIDMNEDSTRELYLTL